MQRFRGMNRDCVLRNPEITRAVWHGRWNWIAPGGQSRALPLEFNHTCLPACDIIVMRVRALYTPFRAKCTVQSVDEASDQQDETTRAATSHRMFVRTSISLDIACRAMSDCTSPCAFRACLLAADAADGFIHARACDVTHYTTRSRSEAFSSLPELSR